LSWLSLSREAAIVYWSVMGLFVGSFLNVAIHRLPLEGETVSKPRRSRCPNCKTTLTWKENVPLVSWIVQLGKCRTCKWPIPWRYPLVELLTATLWGIVAWRTLPERFDLCLVHTVVLSGLVVATFVDFACFEIPDEVSIGGMVLAPLASLLVPDLHAGSAVAAWMDGEKVGEVSRLAALSSCFAGMIVGGGILLLIGKVGRRGLRRAGSDPRRAHDRRPRRLDCRPRERLAFLHPVARASAPPWSSRSRRAEPGGRAHRRTLSAFRSLPRRRHWNRPHGVEGCRASDSVERRLAALGSAEGIFIHRRGPVCAHREGSRST
jgi:prepilin signal peptidase PulO-like enzyme (type II secretory pathway)